jgi:8-oxo-dGTP pyrophosphatase MutT (NUDIX family)
MASAQGDDGSQSTLEFVQKAFIVKDGCLLLVQRAATDPNHPGQWEIPGGRMHPGEDIDTHICREVAEETGIAVKPGQPLDLWQWDMVAPSGSGERVHVVAVARICTPLTDEFDFSNRQPDDHLGQAVWVPLDKIDCYELIPDLAPAMKSFFRILEPTAH